jgi:hypothetical protein
MKKLLLILVTGLFLTGAYEVRAESADACVDSSNGNARILFPYSSSEECRNSETPVSLSVNENGSSGPQVFDSNGTQVGALVSHQSRTSFGSLPQSTVLAQVDGDYYELTVARDRFILSNCTISLAYTSNDCSGQAYITTQDVNAFQRFDMLEQVCGAVEYPSLLYKADDTAAPAIIQIASFKTLDGVCTPVTFSREVYPANMVADLFDIWSPPFSLVP